MNSSSERLTEMNTSEMMVKEVNEKHNNGSHSTTNGFINKDTLTSFLICSHIIPFNYLIRDCFCFNCVSKCMPDV